MPSWFTRRRIGAFALNSIVEPRSTKCSASGSVGPNAPSSRPCLTMPDDHGKDRDETAKRGGVEVPAAVGQLAQHERRHHRMVGKERRQLLDPPVYFLVGAGVRIGDYREPFRERLNADGHHLAVERELAAEVVVEERLVDARAAGDPIDAGGREAAVRELMSGGAQDRGALVALDPLSSCSHNN